MSWEAASACVWEAASACVWEAASACVWEAASACDTDLSWVAASSYKYTSSWSQPHRQQAQLFIFASLHLAAITGVPHSWPNGSAGVPAVPATKSMSACWYPQTEHCC
jgi:hypothetical protein